MGDRLAILSHRMRVGRNVIGYGEQRGYKMAPIGSECWRLKLSGIWQWHLGVATILAQNPEDQRSRWPVLSILNWTSAMTHNKPHLEHTVRSHQRGRRWSEYGWPKTAQIYQCGLRRVRIPQNLPNYGEPRNDSLECFAWDITG